MGKLDSIRVPKIIIAFDHLDSSDLLKQAKVSYEAGIDVIEIGTPIITRYGVGIIEKLRKKIPKTTIYADIKSIDFCQMEVKFCITKGCNITSVSAFASKENLIAAKNICENYGVELFVTFMGYPDSLIENKASELRELGLNNFIAHGAGQSTITAFRELRTKLDNFKNVSNAKLIIAGGISSANVLEILNFKPHYIIVGRGLTGSSNLKESIVDFNKTINEAFS